MEDEKKDKSIISVICPCCQATLWIDKVTGEVMEGEKPAKKKKGSLDDLLDKEHKRKSEFDRKFDAGFELEREKLSKADELFRKALEKAGDGSDGGDDDQGS